MLASIAQLVFIKNSHSLYLIDQDTLFYQCQHNFLAKIRNNKAYNN